MIYSFTSESFAAYLIAFRSQGVDGARGKIKGGSKVANAGGKGVIVSGCA